LSLGYNYSFGYIHILGESVLRRIFFWFLIIAILVIFAVNWQQILAIFKTLLHGEWQWVLAAVGLQICSMLAFTLGYKISFRVVDIRIGFGSIISILLGSLVVTAVAPGSSPAGSAMVIYDISQRGFAAARITAGVMLQMIAGFSTLSLIIIAGLVYHELAGNVELVYWLSAAASLVMTAMLVATLLVGLYKPDWLSRIFSWMARLINWISAWTKRPGRLSEDWVEKSASEFLDASRLIFHHPIGFILIMSMLFAVHLSAIACLGALFMAFNQPIIVGTLIVAYTVGLLVANGSPTPSYTGIVEGSVALALVSLHIPWQAAIAITLSYRGISFWMPLAIGVLVLHRMKTFQVPVKKAEKNLVE
jgi:uncharacterized protein (TIRG00374 family)